MAYMANGGEPANPVEIGQSDGVLEIRRMMRGKGRAVGTWAVHVDVDHLPRRLAPRYAVGPWLGRTDPGMGAGHAASVVLADTPSHSDGAGVAKWQTLRT